MNYLDEAFEEGYYQALCEISDNYYEEICGDHVTDVFKNFEDKFSNDDTTMIKVNDVKQKDRFYSDREKNKLASYNKFMAMHERNKNIGVENKVFCNSNYLKESYADGYYEGLKAIEESAKHVLAGAAAIGTTGAIAHSIYKSHKMATDMNYRKQQYEKSEVKNKKQYKKYKAKGGSLSYEDWKNPKKREYEMHVASGGKMSYDEYHDHKRKVAEKRKQQEKERLERQEREARIRAANAAAERDREASRDSRLNRYEKYQRMEQESSRDGYNRSYSNHNDSSSSYRRR